MSIIFDHCLDMSYMIVKNNHPMEIEDLENRLESKVDSCFGINFTSLVPMEYLNS